MLLCDPDVRQDGAAVLDEIAAFIAREPGVLGWGGPTAVLPTSEDPARTPADQGQGGSAPGPPYREAAAADHRDVAAPAPCSTTIRVLLVDDHVAVRQAFAFALSQETGLAVVGGAGDGPAALDQARQLRPDVVLMDVNLPGMSGIEATRRLLAEFPAIAVIGLSMYESEEIGTAMRHAGARAYVSKSASYDLLLAAIRAVRETDSP